jgi:pilus assembly protein CpaD
MREMTQILLRGLCLTAVLMAGSCTSPVDDANVKFDDPLVNHPIMVEPSYQSLKVSYSAAGLNVEDTSHLDAFVAAYRQHGNGKIAISVPNGLQQAVTPLADRINEMGVSRDQILVASHDAPAGDARVEINYISYQARTAPCGDWSEDLSYTIDNHSAANFGCANQHNLAAMVADPRDILGPRPMDAADGRRRQTVITNYDAGTATAAAKSNDQSAAISDIGK